MKNIIFILLFSCCTSLFAQQKTTDKAKPFVLGEIQEINSKVLGENRTLNIYLPVGYNESDTGKYPVIYLLDGSADEDFIHIAGLVQYANFPWVNMLPNSIVVGIANVDRRRDYSFPTTIEKDKKDFPTTGKSENFIRFLETELQPFINSTYRTNSSKTIIGQSFGGLVATEILFKKPELFSTYIIISPSLWWDNESLLSIPPKVIATSFTKPVSVFIGSGREGKRMENDMKRLVNVLTKDHKKNIKVQYQYFNDENHASILHNAVYKAFLVLNKQATTKK